MRRAVVQIARKVNVQHLLRVAGRGKVRAQILQPSRAEPRLLRELTRSRQLRRFARFELAGRQLEQRARKRIAVLPHAPDRAVGLQRQHRHAARMLHDLALGRAAVGQARLVEPDVDDHAVVACDGLEFFFDQFHEPPLLLLWHDTIFPAGMPYILSSTRRLPTPKRRCCSSQDPFLTRRAGFASARLPT